MSDRTRTLGVAARRLSALRFSRLAGPLRLLTPLGRGVLATGVVATALAVRLSWHEFTLLAAVAFGLRPSTPKDCDFIPVTAISNPSAANPRLSNSRTAAARLGMRLWNRKSSTSIPPG